MEHTTSITSLLIVVIVSFLVPIILHRLKLKAIPIVVAEIIAGIIIGQSGLNLVQEDNWLELLSLLGFIYLMFLSGLEIDFSFFKIKRDKSTTENNKQSYNPLLVSIIVFGFIFVLSFGLALLLKYLGFVEEPFLMTLIISTISLGVVVPVLKEKNIIDKPFGQTILLVAVISDFATMILLAFYVLFLSENVAKILLLLLFFLIVIIAYYFIRHYFRIKIFDSLLSGTAQLGTRGVFALILAFVALSETLGSENILGAFLAGVIISLLAPKKEFIHKLDSFGYGFLIPIFFVMIGVNLDLKGLIQEPNVLLLIPILLLTLFISKIFPVLFLKKWFSWKEVLGAGFLLTSTLSLVIAAAQVALDLDLITQTFNDTLVLMAIISCFISPILFNQFIPQQKEGKKKLAIIGANNITLPTAVDLNKDRYDIKIFATKNTNSDLLKEDEIQNNKITKMDEITIESLKEENVFDYDILIIATTYDELNLDIAKYATDNGVKRVIAKVENTKLQDKYKDSDISIFSTLFSSQTLLKILVEYPSFTSFFINGNNNIFEIKLNNPDFSDSSIRELSFLKNILVLQIHRGDSFLIPNGDTTLKVGDRLLVSGDTDSVNTMKDKFK